MYESFLVVNSLGVILQSLDALNDHLGHRRKLVLGSLEGSTSWRAHGPFLGGVIILAVLVVFFLLVAVVGSLELVRVDVVVVPHGLGRAAADLGGRAGVPLGGRSFGRRDLGLGPSPGRLGLGFGRAWGPSPSPLAAGLEWKKTKCGPFERLEGPGNEALTLFLGDPFFLGEDFLFFCGRP